MARSVSAGFRSRPKTEQRTRAGLPSLKKGDWRRAVLRLDATLTETQVKNGFGTLVRAKQWLQAAQLLGTASSSSVRLDAAAYNAAASACNSARSSSLAWRLAAWSMNWIRQLGLEVDVFSYGAAAVTYSNLVARFSSSFWNHASSLLGRAQLATVRLSVVAWGSVLDASSKAGQWRGAAALVRAMQHGDGPVPDTHCINVLLSSVSRASRESWQLGLDFFRAAATSVGLDEVSFNAALLLLEGSESAVEAWTLISMMRRASIRPSQVTYGTAARTFGISSAWSCAVETLCVGSLSGVPSSIVAYGAALDACQRGGAWTVAMLLLHSICTVQLESNAPACGAAITAAGNCHQWSHALSLLGQASTVSIPTTAPTLGAVMSACEGAAADGLEAFSPDSAARWQQVLDLFQRIQALGVPDLPMIGSSVSACSKGQQWLRALGFLGFAGTSRVQPSLVVVNAALDGLDRAGHWAGASSLLASVSQNLVQVDSLGLRSIMQAAQVGSSAGQIPGQFQHVSKPWCQGHSHKTFNLTHATYMLQTRTPTERKQDGITEG